MLTWITGLRGSGVLIAAAVVAVAATVLVSCAGDRLSQQAQSDISSDVIEPRSGAQIYAATCARCHGAEGEGESDWMVRKENGRLRPPPLNGDGHTWHHADGVLFRIVSEGGAGVGYGSDMPSFKDELSREDIIAVLEFVKSWWEGKEIDGTPIAEPQREFSLTDPYPAASELSP